MVINCAYSTHTIDDARLRQHQKPVGANQQPHTAYSYVLIFLDICRIDQCAVKPLERCDGIGRG